MRGDHPEGEALGWRLLDTEVPFENRLLRLRVDRIAMGDEKETEYAYVEKGTAVLIVPITPDRRMVLVRQYRHPVDDHCLEVPAGTARDTRGLSVEEVAAKELREEVGGTFDELELLGSFYSNSSLTDERCHVFIAYGVRLTERPEREPGEKMKTITVPVAEGVALARSAKLSTGPAALAVLLAEPRLKERGFL